MDILVEYKKVPDLLEFIEMEEYLCKQLKTHVDLVPKRKLKSQIKEQILQIDIIIEELS